MADFYTKAVLTVIAAALCVLATENIVAPASAQWPVTRVIICDALSPSICASLSGNALQVSPR